MAAPSKITAAIASARFDKALLDLAAAGLRTHCSDAGSHGLWLSDHAGLRGEAVRLCNGCLVLTLCGEAASARCEQFGVWAGLDRARGPGKVGRPTTRPVDRDRRRRRRDGSIWV
jgi:hypothetical protein